MHLCKWIALLENSYHKAQIVEIIEVTPLIRRIFIKYPFDVKFKSGQFVILDFGNLEHQFSTRSYSIADYTDQSTIELCVVLKEDGAATPILFNQQVGSEVLASIPQGRFVLPETLEEKPICFICTGTGVAPFRAMIKDLLLHRQFKNDIYLYFGCRTINDILYRSEFETLSQKFPQFKYIPVLSREHWQGATGYVHPYYLEVFDKKPDALFYLCGWTEMIKETRDHLKAIGYTRADIKVEFYD